MTWAVLSLLQGCQWNSNFHTPLPNLRGRCQPLEYHIFLLDSQAPAFDIAFCLFPASDPALTVQAERRQGMTDVQC